MGYTHYWNSCNTISNFDPQTLNAIKAIALDYDLCYEQDQPYEKPEILTNRVRFNGRNEKGFETFYFDFTRRFCKTGEREYDLLVCLILMVIKYYLRDNIRITSDGNNYDWTPAFNVIGNYIPDVLFQIKERKLTIITK